ncbi:MAG: RES domain-containing protein [Proteobacteria bacterium]|nr:RES domain-containing protein [Pseudomonadota bacterium]
MIEQIESAQTGWDAQPESKASLDFGDAWLASGASALLVVPSVVVPEEFNVLINPSHPDAKLISAAKQRKFLYDQRLLG